MTNHFIRCRIIQTSPPPPLSDDVLPDVQYNTGESEDFSQSEFQNDEKPLLPLPAPINSANSLLDFSGEHI
jgi:hypothetical protein